MEDFIEERVIGSGNYGTVVVVRHLPTGVLYCLKKINWANKTDAQRNDSINEVNVMAQLSHPNIIIFYKAFVQRNMLHILMEYADATDLEKYLIDKIKKGNVVSEGTTMKIFVQIAIGLRQLHRQHLLHRDLKSANVFLSRNGRVKLGDFGFSKQLNYSMGLTSTVCGTPYYFSPEICQKMKYNNKIDIWSLGVILYEIINLRKPFEGRNLHELRKRVVNENPAPFTATNISRDLVDLCLLLLCKDSSKRPSIEEVLRIPIVQVYMRSLEEILVKQRDELHNKAQGILAAYPRKDGETLKPVEFISPFQRYGATTTRRKFDKLDVAKAIQGVSVDLNSSKSSSICVALNPEKVHEVQSLHTIQQPNVMTMVSNDCPVEILSQLHNIILQEEHCTITKNDIDDILNTEEPDNDESFDDISIGEAESDEEKKLRDALGNNFIKGIELALILSEVPVGSPKADDVIKELMCLLGEKSYLLPDLQMVAIQFELES